MFTVAFVLHEKFNLDRKAALDFWRSAHGPIVAKVPGVQRYVQQHAVAAPQDPPPFLGVASLTFADEAAFNAAVGSSEFAAAIADVANFADMARLPTAFVEDVVIVG